MGKINAIWKNLRIRSKIIIAYLSLLVVSFLVTLSAVFGINQAYMQKEIGHIGAQTVHALGGNLSLIFENVTKFSDFIYFDKEVQDSLRHVQQTSIRPDIYRTITDSLINIILSGDYISGVYIRDSYGNFYSSYKKAPKNVYPDRIMDTAWYREIPAHNGDGFFIHGSEGIIEYYGDIDYITYVREIRDKNNYKPLATLMVTVNEETIQSYFDEVGDAYESQFFVVDAKGRYIVHPVGGMDFVQYAEKDKGCIESGDRMRGENGEAYVFATQEMEIENWQLVGAFQMENTQALAPYYTTVVLLIILLNILFVFICSMLLTKLIFRPLSKVEKHMLLVEKGQFVMMTVNGEFNEITNLKRVYNHMVSSIQELIEKVKTEEKIIAKGELDLLQAQINPHFLYNTLDAISALALMKDYDNCLQMTQALGAFYRNSLNSGQAFVTVKDEVECVRSYLTIVNIRYDNKIKLYFDVEEEAMGEYTIKLILQPLVENAVQHGIHEKNGDGSLWIRVFLDEDELIFMVTDDGAGMSQERIQEIMDGRSITEKSGFGIHSLIQRVQLYYGIENPVMIHSEPGDGTEVAVRVKREREERGRQDGV